ncbi:hypothetical protein QKU48_gp0226 [Fadolivirus algeromassiliense]|jgi:hypothetical protein|uniref:Uncharacterized protein n=1 Tax=Fadolivirus FV1/VV64 TaxID=3070911 RepID=A0A7D3QUM5_9VIRU|nr:hypothetical protein QKU48_gp0226 [Fadolivirus algeromassiliense]QKF93684.1 hypothetical protein Fadolivirus_1_226 [Fadolivirus FV1/VV64]
MDKIIIFLVKKNFTDIEHIITNSEISKSEYINLVYFIFFQYTNNKFNDVSVFVLLFLLLLKYKILHINDIQNIQLLIKWHRENKYTKNYTYKFIETNHHLSIVENNLFEIISMYKDLNPKIFKNLKEKNYLDEFRNIIKNTIRPLINSFNDNFIIANRPDNKDKQKYDYFINLVSNEILVRLKNFVKIFGVKLLEKTGVKIITSIDFESMNINERIEYYNHCLTKINDVISSIEYLYIGRDRIKTIIDDFNIDYKLLNDF